MNKWEFLLQSIYVTPYDVYVILINLQRVVKYIFLFFWRPSYGTASISWCKIILINLFYLILACFLACFVVA